MIYVIRQVSRPPEADEGFEHTAWGADAVARVEQFHPESSSHRPVTQARVMRDQRELHLRFRVDDCYVRCTRTGFQEMVSRDSCVEMFVQPRADKGYFSFEFNCGGAMLLYYIEDATRKADGSFASYQVVPRELGELVRVQASMPSRVEPEIQTPVTWELGASIPVELLEAFVGPLGTLSGQRWRGNFFKCGDETSHPHWASWSPIGSALRFHQPDRFGTFLLD